MLSISFNEEKSSPFYYIIGDHGKTVGVFGDQLKPAPKETFVIVCDHIAGGFSDKVCLTIGESITNKDLNEIKKEASDNYKNIKIMKLVEIEE